MEKVLDESHLISERLKILFFYSNPGDLSRIRLGVEVREIEQAIHLSKFRDHFELKVIHAPRPADIRRALLEHHPHVLHFSGHGSKTKGIFVQDDEGNSKPIQPEALAELLRIIKDNLRLVVFNACYSAPQAAAISQIIDFTIGMQDTIFDPSAIKFSAAIYEAMASGRTVSESFELAVNALSLEDISDANVPILLAERGIDPATTCLVPLVAPSPPPPETDTDGTMHLDLIVLGRASPKIIKAWHYNTDSGQPFFVTADEKAERITPRQAWQELCELRGPTAKAPGGGGRTLDIFLRLRENAIETLINHERLANMVDEALYHAVGNNLFIAWNQETFSRLYQNPGILEGWFSRLVRSGVTDLIEIPPRPGLNDEAVISILYERALQSQHRRERLWKLVSAEDWNLVLDRPLSAKLSLPKFIDAFQASEQLMFDGGNNLAVFYEKMPRQGWLKLIEHSRLLKRNGNWFIATLSKSDDLAEFWRLEDRESKPKHFDGVFEFSGCFEWLYAFLRLQLAARVAQLTSTSAAGKALF